MVQSSTLIHASTMTDEGEITVPLEVQEHLGLKPGDLVEFFEEHGQTLIRRVETEENPFLKDIGIAPGFGTIEEINAWIREMRDDEDEPR